MSFLPAPVTLCITITIVVLNTLICCSCLFIAALVKLILPSKTLKKRADKLVIFIADTWIGINSNSLKLFTKTEIKTTGIEQLTMDEWYLVISNHQSWVDIIILQSVLKKKIPFLKFFLKKELIWVPYLGLAWWALEFPFMKRYTKNFIKKNPHLKGKDLESTKKACEKFKLNPVSVMNFLEGTRFSKEKHKKQNSPYKNLLTPKAGGIAFVLGAMGDHLNKIVNVTILYPNEKPYFQDLLSGKISKVHVNIEVTPVTDEIIGDYFNDPIFREGFQAWVNNLWEEKDRLIEEKI
ncbi:MAG: acyltransferase [Desulfobacterales bacterium]|nr:acyltransferase [Desulfobacterales bacterium]MCP4159160.1 acyltransferase [Deltaproteobacteria bacterium]